MAIARDLNGRYLCLYGADRVLFDTTGVLAPIGGSGGRAASAPQFNDAARCYRWTTP
jgi:hypothetical protein